MICENCLRISRLQWICTQICHTILPINVTSICTAHAIRQNISLCIEKKIYAKLILVLVHSSLHCSMHKQMLFWNIAINFLTSLPSNGIFDGICKFPEEKKINNHWILSMIAMKYIKNNIHYINIVLFKIRTTNILNVEKDTLCLFILFLSCCENNRPWWTWQMRRRIFFTSSKLRDSNILRNIVQFYE